MSQVDQAARRPTLKQVAARAGVAVSTASLVFSGRGPVSDEMAARVRIAAAELDYAGPDPIARSLRRGRAGVVGVIGEGTLMQALRDPYALGLLDGIMTGLDNTSTGLLLIAQSGSDPEAAIDQIAGTALDAVAFPLCGPRSNPVVEHLAGRGVPMVGTGAPEDDRVVQLTVDNRAAQAEVAAHVRDLGHTRVAHIAMPLNVAEYAVGTPRPFGPAEVTRSDFPDAQQRVRGFRDVFPDGPMITAPVSIEGGQAAARALLAADPRPTAIITQADTLAAGVIRAAEDLGLRVPDDLSVTGFDGVDLPWLPVTLTTIDQGGQAQGRRLAEMMLALARGEKLADEPAPYRLLIGNSTTTPR